MMMPFVALAAAMLFSVSLLLLFRIHILLKADILLKRKTCFHMMIERATAHG
jgi:hypothetical protein